MKWTLVAAAAIIGYQILCPPIIGLADQGDFRRVIGKFGYGPEQPATYYGFVTLKYVRDLAYRWPDWEQFSSEDLFVGAAVLANKVVSKDGKLDIRVIGVLHALAFLAAFAWLLHETRGFPQSNSSGFFSPDSNRCCARDLLQHFLCRTRFIHLLRFLVSGEHRSVRARNFYSTAHEMVPMGSSIRTRKPMNAPLGLLLGAYAIRLGWRSKLAWAGTVAILSAAVFIIVTAPMPMRDVNAYDLVFLAVLPESKTPAADAVTLGIDPALAVLSGTGAWGANSAFSELKLRGIIGKQVTIFTIMRFYLARPARMWRRIRRELQVAILLRPPTGKFRPLVRTSGRVDERRFYALERFP